MAFWFASMIFVILPGFNLGLLSDYKICGDAECESLMSRVQAVRDHRAKDCRFLSFRQGDTIFVYHKLTGKREDLWAGTIDRKFGYFPKDAVQEEQVYAATEKVVETQKSDFICMDEYGYPIDSSHLDNSDEDGDHNQQSEIIQTIAHPDDTKAKHPSTSIDSLSESPDQPDATSREEDKSQNSGITASTTREDTHETPAALGEQGGSPSASWLGSSVTGWLGLGKEEQTGNVPEREEPQQEASLTSSVTGWLGFGGEKKLDDTVNNREEDKEVDASFTSTMTGWLGLGGEKKTDATKHQHEEKDINDESEPKETFRSRRMSLDLEGSQLQEEEKEVGTLDWLGNGLSSTLGFGVKNQETDPIKEEKEKPTSSSWLDIGVGDILGFGKPKNEVDESTRSDFKQKEKDTTLEEATPSVQAEISQSQPVHEEQRKTEPDEQRLEEKVGMETLQEMGDNINSSSSKDTNELNVEEHVEDYFSHSEVMSATSTLEEGFNNNTAASDGSEGNSLPVDQKDVSTQTTSEESPQALGGGTSTIDEGSPEATGEGHQIYKSTGNDYRNNNRDLEEEKIKSASDDRDLLTQLNTDLESDHYSMDSKGQYEANTDGGQQESKTTEHLEDESAKITNQVENREESTMVVLELSGKNDAHEEENSAERDVPTLTESAEPIREEGSISEDSNIEKESHNVVGIQNGEARSLSVYENPSEDQILARDTIIQHKDPEPGSLENEEVIVLKETAKQEEFGGVKDGERQQIMKERKQEEDNIKKAEMEEEKENQEDIKMGKEEEMEEVKEEVHQDRKKELKKEEIQERVDIVQEEMRQEEIEKEGENEEQEVRELKEEEKGEDEEMVGLEGAKEREKWDGWGEAEKREKTQQVEEVASMEKQKDNEGEESVEEEKGEVLNDVKEEGNQVKTVEFQVEEREAEVEKVGKRKEEKEQVEEQQHIVAGSNEKEREKKRQEEIHKSKEEEKQEKLNKLNDLKEKEKENSEEITVQEVPHLEAQKETIHDIGKPELESSEETHDENIKTEENKREEMKHDNVEESKEEETAGDEMQQVTDVEDERRNNEEEESHQCSNKPQHQDTEDELAGIRNENISELKPSSADDSMIKQRKHNEHILESETISSEGTETDRLSEEEPEKASDDSEVVEGEKTDITSNATGSESIYSKNVNVSDHNGLKVEQMGAASHTDNDQHVTGESGHSGRPDGMSLDETSERKEHGHQAQNDRLSQGHVSHGPVGSGANNRLQIESEGGGAFGLFKNAFSFFSQTPVTKTKEPTASTPGLDTDTAETSPPQAFLTLEQKSDSTTNSNQVPVKETHKDSPVSVSTQQHRQPPPASALSPETAAHTKSLAKYYKNLLSHVSVEELTYLVDLFGQNKLQFLDYSLGSSENHTDDPDHDESILSDIERLLHHHRETLAMSQEANEKTKTLVALQKLEMLLDKLREAFSTRKSDVSKANRQADASCVGASCSTNGKDQKEPQTTQDFSVAKDTEAQRDKRKPEEIDNGQPGAVTEESRETEVWTGRQKKTQSHPRIQGGSPQPQEGVMKQSLDFVRQIVTDSVTYGRATREAVVWITVQVVSSLPDDLRPGPDLYGLPWEPVIISSVVGLVTVLLFTCRCYRSVKSRMYRSKERWMAEQVAQLLDEKCKVLETLSKCQQEYDDLEDSLRDSGVLAQTQKTEQLEIKGRQVEHAKEELERDIGQLKDQLERQREHRLEQERKIAVLEESMKTLEDETKDLQSQEEQVQASILQTLLADAQTTLKVYSMNSDRLQRNLETAGEESTLLQDSNAQLRQQAEGWAERVSELEAEIRRCEVAYSGMRQHVSNKDERIMSLTDHLLRIKAWDSDLEESEEEEKKEASNGTAAKLEGEREDITDTQGHLQKVQKLIYAAKLNADLKSLDEDKDRVFAKLNDEVKAKEDLQESIKELENEKLLLQSDAEQYSDQVQRLQQKLHIMTEMYQDNELKLHRLLTVEERERLQKEEKLNKADKNIALAIEEVNNYRQRAEEMEEELEKTRQSYQTQISSHEKKAHNNWLAARAAERDLADIRRENALLRQKLTDTQFKLDAIDKDPYALDSLARPLPFRAERSPYGPSPLGRPASETRPFLSPPTLLDGPPARLSPRMSHGPVEPPATQGEMERSGGPHSDSGSISPTWERDRRGPPLGPHGSIGPPGYMFPEPGGPMYRRPLPPPGAIGILPPPGSLPPGPLLPHPRGFLTGPPSGPPHSTDIADGPYSENTRPIDQQHRESGSGDRRTPPEADLRMGGPLPPGPPMGPMDGPFPRRSPYGPPPPDFYPPRGPGGPAMRPMWAPPPSGMMFPPRFPPSGPPLSNAPHPHFPPAMRPVAPDRLPPSSMGPAPPQQSLPFPPHSQSSEEHATSPEDAI